MLKQGSRGIPTAPDFRYRAFGRFWNLSGFRTPLTEVYVGALLFPLSVRWKYSGPTKSDFYRRAGIIKLVYHPGKDLASETSNDSDGDRQASIKSVHT